ncbi:hypothetical protein GCM10025865_04150 [Paraoerskovia sediminicola]|uniref:ABC transmembrane type-1 domain-containing protein n=1 Tax=Paraoerskovia sediminicola TaxID=1138587 RepID=A0ABN6XC04_9CELL|nr:hypothetical protein GCM10025865_04150 [Paraoerskovia sediminicola]
MSAARPTLPIADRTEVRRTTGALFMKHRRALAGMAVLHTTSAVVGLAGPFLLGRLVDSVTGGTTTGHVDTLVLVLLAAFVVQAVVVRFAQKVSMVFGEQVFAELREDFMGKVTRLPLSVVETAGTGDLLARTTNDINKLQHAIRFGVPQVLVCVITIVLTIAAAVVVAPFVALGLLVGVPIAVVATRRYLARATAGYLRESAAYATLNGTITEAVEEPGPPTPCTWVGASAAAWTATSARRSPPNGSRWGCACGSSPLSTRRSSSRPSRSCSGAGG